MNPKNLTGAIIVFLLAALPLFGHLSELPIQRWDESRLAASAYEMSLNNNWLVPYHFGNPEMISVKPPLQIWFMALSIKLLGANELAVRLPSAIFALLTCMVLYWFLAIKMRSRIQGIIAAAVLIVCNGFVRLHGTRTGDYDSLLTLLTTVFLLHGYMFIRDKQPKHIIISALALTAACFTKGVAPLMFLPPVGIFFAYSGVLKNALSTRAFYIGLVIFILVVPGYYILREQLTPGYLESVSRNELGGRFLATLEGHYQPWYFYIAKIIEWDTLWFFLATASVPLLPIYATNETKRFILYLATVICGFLLFISIAGTKLDWYSMPLYPLLAMMCAVFLQGLFSKLKGIIGMTWVLRSSLALVFLIFYIFSYHRILSKTLKPDYNLQDREFAIGYYLTQIHKGNKGTSKFIVLYSDYEQDMAWHDMIDSNIYFKSIDNLSAGDMVVAYKDHTIAAMEERCYSTLLEDCYGIRRYKIDSLKTITTPQ